MVNEVGTQTEYNSFQPSQLDALAYSLSRDIEMDIPADDVDSTLGSEVSVTSCLSRFRL